ncbi:hypothetical protein AQUCO_01100325v1 [Aquilegia coerulea]|uniref:Lipoxygenase n=1 Tax=Aquilegia coerulea TaxID=218851 RepID=A0A2G5E6R4_AQUCA|nr:hypothetical protein AQUCO_01100325v1 [Aquilegia coerulea]
MAKEKMVTVKAEINAKFTVGELLRIICKCKATEALLLLELVSSELDPETGLGKKKAVQGYAKLGKKFWLKSTVHGYPNLGKKFWLKSTVHGYPNLGNKFRLKSKFDVPESFGDVGAVLVKNEYDKEMYLNNIVLTRGGSSNAPITISCNSWIASKCDDNSQMRIFFTNKSYLPSETPRGLKKLREEDLKNLRGDGKGERKSSDRIYDYDKYNDLGDPDHCSNELARPVLGGTQLPYPRRCRTGRGPSEKDPLSEKRSSSVYVPRDEAFSEPKELEFKATTAKELLHMLVPSIETALNDKIGFPNLTAIDNIFNQGARLPRLQNQGLLQLVAFVAQIRDDILLFDTPEIFKRDKFCWLKDEEFSRQTLAGVNPYSIQLVKEWPLKSKLDPKIYGPCECSITKELLEREIKGIMTVDEALEQKKLFILDYHDLLLPFVKKVRALEDTTMYGSRTIFFLKPDSTLRPIAIELTRPPMGDKANPWKKVFTPGYDATTCWLWKFAKVHVGAHDSGYHELVSHWLRTHCCLEPYIIATHRQLSAMHPIYRLLHPHLRYTMEINVRARLNLINAGGIIEKCFSPGKYSMELSSAAYDQIWRFDMEALPADLIRRGMAVEDPTSPHGLKLTIPDYPFANDGLLVWDAIKSWISDYVSHYYAMASHIETDSELQAWWTEIRTKGHEDKKNELWWPKLKNQDDLIQILTTIAWVASCHHAAVNFGQYTYGGYFPNRPSIARTNMPTEDISTEDHKIFMEKPESVLMKCFPSQIQATMVMAVLRSLSTHSRDEEYLSGSIEPSWDENPQIKKAFERFKKKLIEVSGIIDERNEDPKLLNRTGAGVVPYKLLKPFSEPGVTGMGVPNSTSI